MSKQDWEDLETQMNESSTPRVNLLPVNHSAVEVATDSPADPEAPLSGNMKMWAVGGDQYYPCERTEHALPPAQYIIRHSHQRGIYFERKTVNLDDLIVLPDNNSDRVISAIEDFWAKEDAFREYGFLWKRGILLWGPPGSGKTSTVQQLSKQIIDNGGISIYCTEPQFDAEGLRTLRKIEPNRPIVVIMEDIDAIIQRWGETDLLAMLDGELQVDNVVFVATTNYPEKLDKRFINRPSRFDEVVKIGMPNAACREAYITHKNPRLREDKKALNDWVEKTEGFSVAHIKELIVSVECLGNDFNDATARLRMMNEISVSSESDGRSAGFING